MRKASIDTGLARGRLVLYQVLLMGALIGFWYLVTEPILVSEASAKNTAFFFGRPFQVIKVVIEWFTSGKIYPHLAITLWEALLAFAIGSVLGLGIGLWLALSPMASALADPYITAMNAMPRVILAPIFAVWFGLGVLSKVALGVTLGVFHRLLQRLPGCEGGESGRTRERAHVGCVEASAAAAHLPAVGDVVGVLQPAHVGRHGVRRRGRRRVPGLGERGRLPDPAGRGRVRHQYRHRGHIWC
jgi:hypothetical protein